MLIRSQFNSLTPFEVGVLAFYGHNVYVPFIPSFYLYL